LACLAGIEGVSLPLCPLRQLTKRFRNASGPFVTTFHEQEQYNDQQHVCSQGHLEVRYSCLYSRPSCCSGGASVPQPSRQAAAGGPVTFRSLTLEGRCERSKVLKPHSCGAPPGGGGSAGGRHQSERPCPSCGCGCTAWVPAAVRAGPGRPGAPRAGPGRRWAQRG
jgi:hypothetical protein